MLMSNYQWLWVGTVWTMYMAVVLFGAAVYGTGLLIKRRRRREWKR